MSFRRDVGHVTRITCVRASSIFGQSVFANSSRFRRDQCNRQCLEVETQSMAGVLPAACLACMTIVVLTALPGCTAQPGSSAPQGSSNWASSAEGAVAYVTGEPAVRSPPSPCQTFVRGGPQGLCCSQRRGVRLFHQRPAVEHDSSATASDLAIVHDMARCCAVGSVIGVVVVGMIVAAVIVCNVRMRHDREGDGSEPVGACRNMPLALI